MKFVVLIVLLASSALSFDIIEDNSLEFTDLLVTDIATNPFRVVSNFTLGTIVGLQTKATPLSACYNQTNRLNDPLEAAGKLAVKCMFLNFTACDLVPAQLTLFNARAMGCYNTCKLPVLISKIEALKTPDQFSSLMLRYFTFQSKIKGYIAAMKIFWEAKNYFSAGIQFGTIIRTLLSFSVS